MSQQGKFQSHQGPIVDAEGDNPEYILFQRASFTRGTPHLALAGMVTTLCGRKGAIVAAEVILFRGNDWKKLCGKCRPIAEAMVMSSAPSYPSNP